LTISFVNLFTMSIAQKQRRPVRPYRGVSAEDRVAERRERFLAAGLDEFGRRGVLATGVKDVCRQAGLTDRYFYESFGSTSELFVAVFDRATARLYEVTASAVAGVAAEPTAQARAAIDAYVRALAGDPRLARVVFVEAPSAGPEVERHMRATLRRFATLVESAARPYLPAHMPDDAVRFGAISLVGAIERLMIEWQDGELGLEIEQIIDYLVELLVSAVRVADLTASKPVKGRGKRASRGTR
jgi:AcrR family transcriptional regulator